MRSNSALVMFANGQYLGSGALRSVTHKIIFANGGNMLHNFCVAPAAKIMEYIACYTLFLCFSSVHQILAGFIAINLMLATFP